MNDNKGRWFWLGVVIGLAVSGLVAFVTLPMVEQASHERGTKRVQRDAMKVGAARYDIDEQTGDPVFKWKTCTALGVRQ